MRKSWTALLLAAALTLTLAACGGTAEEPEDDRLQVVATLFPYYDIARAIAGERAEVTLLVSAGRESHSYEPTPMDIIRIGRADLFLYNGGTDETWAAEVLASNAHGLAIPMLEQVETLAEETVEGMQSQRGHDHDHDDHDLDDCLDPDDHFDDHDLGDLLEDDHDDRFDDDHDLDDLFDDDHDHGDHAHEIEYDEHIWTSPVNAMTIARVTAEAMMQTDPVNAAYYEENLQSYLAALRALDQELRAVVENGQRRLIVLGDRFPLLYFCREYGLDYRAAFSGCSTETEPSAATMAYLIDRVRGERIPCVYYLENSSARVADAIAEASGAEPCLIYSCQTVSPADLQAGETYLSLMERNVSALRKGLN